MNILLKARAFLFPAFSTFKLNSKITDNTRLSFSLLVIKNSIFFFNQCILLPLKVYMPTEHLSFVRVDVEIKTSNVFLPCFHSCDLIFAVEFSKEHGNPQTVQPENFSSSSLPSYSFTGLQI